jgi:chemotaxis protein histidine kinase CheA
LDQKEIVIFSYKSGKLALLVDQILDAEEVVTRPIDDFVNSQFIFKGAALLDDGGIGLVLDLDGVARLIKNDSNQSPSDQSNELFNKFSSNEKNAEEIHSYILVEAEEGIFCAIPQEAIFRVEMISPDRVQFSESSMVMVYRNQITKLKPFNVEFNIISRLTENSLKISQNETIPIIVTENNSRYRCFTVRRIIDNLDLDLGLIMSPLPENKSSKGHFIYDNCLYMIIDPNQEKSKNQSNIDHNLSPIKNQDIKSVSAIEKNQKNVVGWGLFE